MSEDIAAIAKGQRAFLKRRYCGWCEAPIAGNSCYAMYGEKCAPEFMEQRRANALASYKPRSKAHLTAGDASSGMGDA